MSNTNSTIKERLIKRLPNIITTKTGFLKLDQEQKEALADRLLIFLKLESASMIEAQGQEKGIRDEPIFSLN